MVSGPTCADGLAASRAVHEHQPAHVVPRIVLTGLKARPHLLRIPGAGRLARLLGSSTDSHGFHTMYRGPAIRPPLVSLAAGSVQHLRRVAKSRGAQSPKRQ